METCNHVWRKDQFYAKAGNHFPGIKAISLVCCNNDSQKNKFMKRLLLFVFLSIALYSPARSQLSVAKMFGKNAFNSTIGFGLFDYTDFPVNAIGNRSVIFGFDFAFFPPKDPDINSVIGYASIKVGYRYIFSEETRTGFYVEPSLGYCKVANDEG